jgi:hypothetical protein
MIATSPMNFSNTCDGHGSSAVLVHPMPVARGSGVRRRVLSYATAMANAWTAIRHHLDARLKNENILIDLGP